MNYTEGFLLEQVRMTLDQNQVETSVIDADEDTLNLDDIIRGKLIEAACDILRSAPLRMIDGTRAMEFFDHEGAVSRGYGAEVMLPADYLRLAYARMSDWLASVREATLDNTEAAMLATSEFAGVRPNPYRPMVVETEASTGEPVLKLYGSLSNMAACVSIRYIPLPSFKDSVLRFPKLLLPALVNMAAGLTAMAYGDARAANLINMARGYLGLPAADDNKKK